MWPSSFASFSTAAIQCRARAEARLSPIPNPIGKPHRRSAWTASNRRQHGEPANPPWRAPKKKRRLRPTLRLLRKKRRPPGLGCVRLWLQDRSVLRCLAGLDLRFPFRSPVSLRSPRRQAYTRRRLLPRLQRRPFLHLRPIPRQLQRCRLPQLLPHRQFHRFPERSMRRLDQGAPPRQPPDRFQRRRVPSVRARY
jgi:hypothetical protein